MSRYPALKIISKFYQITGVIILIVACFAPFPVYDIFKSNLPYPVIVCVLLFVVLVIVGVSLIAFGDILKCLIDIEDNTRRKTHITVTKTD
jgi:putative effector of murein hydrolase LrgA (UPF0299 family)